MRKWAGTVLRLAVAIAAVAPCAGRSAPVERDLGDGLAFFRLHAIPSDLPSDASVRQRPCVLDVRYVSGSRTDATALLAWLKLHAGPRTPVFLLANPATSAALLAPLNSADAVPHLVILGPAARDFEPDIALPVAPEIERRAYDALEKGASIDSLIAEPVEKVRDDEERLEREHLPDGALSDQSADPGPSARPPAPPPLIDAVLQRAVQLHRTLLALKRLQESAK